MMRVVLPLLAAGFRLRTRESVTPVEVVKVSAVVEHVDFSMLAQHQDLVEFATEQLTTYISQLGCGSADAGDLAAQNASFLSVGRNATNGTNATEAAGCGLSTYIRLSGSAEGMHIAGELSAEAGAPALLQAARKATALPDAQANLAAPEVAEELSNFLLTVPPVLLYSSSPPIVHFVTVTNETVTPVIPECEKHLPSLIASFRRAYTNRMVPFALDGACGSFMTTLSFATTTAPTDADRVFCETATKHLMNTHFAGDKEYADWCVTVCERRHGKTAVCSSPGAAPDAAADVAAALVHAAKSTPTTKARQSRVMGKMRRMQKHH